MSQNKSSILINKRIGQWLRKKRLGNGITQSQLAKSLGRSVSFVGKYEAGRCLEICEAVAICLSLGADPHELVKTVEKVG